MGTNYYVKGFEDPEDDGAGWHLGKQSAGHPWCWADPPEMPSVVDAWMTFAWEHPGLTVVDEYGRDIGDLFTFVSERKDSDSHNPGKGWC